MTVTQTLAPSLCGEEALSYLPDRDGGAGEVVLFGEPLRQIDAYGGAALRLAVEYHCRYLQHRMTISLPGDPDACAMLHGLLRRDHPAHLVLPHDSEEQRSPLPAGVLLQATPIADRAAAASAAAEICAAAPEPIRRPARFLAKCLPELTQNAIDHSLRNPLPPVACAVREEPSGGLQLVVADLGRPSRPFTESTLRTAVERGGDDAGLRSIPAQATGRGLGLSIEIAAGSGRMGWNGKRWESGRGARLQGFCVGLRIQT